MRAATPTRRHDAAESRNRLLVAADELFAERGYERTTVRDIGARAGVDPALIARYFGSKSALYLSALRREGRPPVPPPDRVDLEAVLGRLLRRGPSPALWAVVRRHEDRDLQEGAMQVVEDRLLGVLGRAAAEAGLPLPRVRAEIVVAALTGIVLSRTSGGLTALAEADEVEVVRLAAQLLGSLLTT